MRLHRVLAFSLACLVLGPFSIAAQRLGPEVKRPKLQTGADTNDATAYLGHGTRLLDESPDVASAAFYWAARLDPSLPDALYGRRIALMMQKPTLLKLYFTGGRRARENKELASIDSLRMRSYRLDPFLYRRFDRAFIMAYYRNQVRMDFAGSSQSEIDFAISDYLESLGPNTRAWLYYSQGKMDQALVEYDLAIKKSKTPGYLRFDKSRVLFMQGLNKPALDELNLAVADLRKEDDKKDESVVFYDSKALAEHGVGILHLKLGQVDSAKAAFGRAMTEDLSYFAAHLELGRIALAEKDTVTAVSELGLAAELATDEPWVHFLHGSTLVATGNFADAVASLNRAIELEPYYAAPHFALAQAMEKSGDAEAAKASYSKFLSMAARRDPNRSAASQALTKLGGVTKE